MRATKAREERAVAAPARGAARRARGLLAACRDALVTFAALLAVVLPAGAASDDSDRRLDLRMEGTIASRGAGEAGTGSGSGYRIDTGDRVSILVYDEPDLSVTDARVRSSGTIAFPLLGELDIRGKTADEIKVMVTEQLADGYLRKPSVTVSVDRYRLYYIRGEVERPGGYSYVDGLTVEKAVALAGGFTDRAAESDITLVREANPDEPVKDVELHTPLRPGDVVKIGQSFF